MLFLITRASFGHRQRPILHKPRSVTRREERQDRKLYMKLLKLFSQLKSGFETRTLNIPLGKLARLDLQGIFDHHRYREFWNVLRVFLSDANTFRRILWEYHKQCHLLFADEMRADGSYAPDVHQYKYLDNELPGALFEGVKSHWLFYYDQNLPKIRMRSQKHDRSPRNGVAFFRALRARLKPQMDTIERRRLRLIEDTKYWLKLLNTWLETEEK